MLCLCFVCLRLVCPKLPISLDCPFLLSPSIFSNIYINNVYLSPSILTKSKNNVVSALSWFRAIQSLFFLLNDPCLAEKQQMGVAGLGFTLCSYFFFRTFLSQNIIFSWEAKQFCFPIMWNINTFFHLLLVLYYSNSAAQYIFLAGVSIMFFPATMQNLHF